MPVKFIVWFDDVGKDDIPTVGGKGANLGEMANNRFPIPNGFIVTTQAYYHFLERTGIKQKILALLEPLDVDDTAALEAVTEQVRELILSARMPEEIGVEIQKAYQRIEQKKVGWGNLSSSEQPYVAVRSSATAEDLPEASFAGQQETYLNVIGRPEVVKAVQNCWASLFTPRAVFYRKKQGFGTERVGIAVVVQKMVNSEASGVMFTADPGGDLDKIVVEAAFGLGEVVVGGTLKPDNYVVDKESLQIVHKELAKQDWMLARASKGNKQVNLKPELREKQKISDKLILEVARLGLKLEQHYGKPQDVEFAVEGGKMFLVQTRAITTLHKLKEKVEVAGDVQPLLKGLAASPGVVSGVVSVVPDVKDIAKVQPGHVLVTVMTNPSWVPIMKKCAAIVTDEGGRTSHAAIVSRELQIPCVVGSEQATRVLKDGMTITVDGFKGLVYAGTPPLKKAASQENAAVEVVSDAEVPVLEKALRLPGQVTDVLRKQAVLNALRSRAIKVKVNVALPEAAENAEKTGADGVGLLRAEHMITASGEHPAEFLRRGEAKKLVEVVREDIRKVASHFKGKPVWYRTFDARTDEFRELAGGEKEPHEENPMIGWHGIRRDLDEPELFKAQLRAIFQLRKEGYTNIGVMLPFVISVDEVRKAKALMVECGFDLNDPFFEFGVIVETPAACWVIDELLAEKIRFISFGTNDLTQLTLGIDRNNERIQKQFSEMHPAVLREIEHVITACKKAGVKTSICGQAASNPEMVKTLIGYGIDSVSANIDAVETIRALTLSLAKEQALGQR